MEKKYILFTLILSMLSVFAYAKPVTVLSPDGKNKVVIESDGKVRYSVSRNGTQILSSSPLSLTVGRRVWGQDKKCRKVEQKQVTENVEFAVPRKYRTTTNLYNLATLIFNDYKIEFRVYNDGVAYRFVSTSDNKEAVMDEQVRYCFEQDYKSYTLLTDQLQNWFEQDYTIRNINALPRDSFSVAPVMVEVGTYKVLLAEANLYHYAGMYLQAGDKSFTGTYAKYPAVEEPYEGDNKIYVTKRQDYIIPKCGKRSMPWRVTGIFDNAASILSSELIYLLSDAASGNVDYSWIKPGRVLWDWWNDRNIYNVDFESGINTQTYMYMIDYASKHNIEYILIDEGWSARNDLLTLAPGVDMPAICKYAASKGVGVQLWAKWVNVDRQMEEAFALFGEWGVKGVKVDFMDRNDAKMVDFYERVALVASKNKLLVDLHGSYPNEGMRRKYPNLMTREGVVGLEYNKWSSRATVKHDVIIPFLRMWVGPMDYTPGAMLNTHAETFYYNQHEPMSQGTRSHQLAMYVVYESPLQMVSDSPTKYDENLESFDFIKRIPAVWDETVPLAGEIGEYVAVARRSGDTWFVGVMNGDNPREIELDLSFMGVGNKKVIAHTDGINSHHQAKDYRTIESAVNDKLKVSMVRGGGYVAIINAR